MAGTGRHLLRLPGAWNAPCEELVAQVFNLCMGTGKIPVPPKILQDRLLMLAITM
jgi:hypothetical protein